MGRITRSRSSLPSALQSLTRWPIKSPTISFRTRTVTSSASNPYAARPVPAIALSTAAFAGTSASARVNCPP